MAYKEPDFNQEYVNDLLKRKEFYNLRIDPEYDFRDPPILDDFKGKFFNSNSYQLFIRNLISPNSNHTRLLIKHGTGTGKTISAILVAIEFIKIYKQQYQSLMLKLPPGRKPYSELDRNTPNVFIMGFSGTKSAFLRDIIQYPELGLITSAEKDKLHTFRDIAKSGFDADVKRYNEYYNMLKRKITSKKYGGFFKFFGYQEFVNKLFISDKISLIELESQVAKQSTAKIVDFKTLEEIIEEHINNGDITINKSLLTQFENSLIICDEFHNLYNSYMKNNYGVAIQYILDTFPKIRLLLLSATPITNSPTEIIDIMNFLLPKDKKVRKKEFFINNRKMHKDKLADIGKLLFGKISFLHDIDLRYYPKRIIEGEEIKLGKTIEGKNNLPYLKFIQCFMSPFHQTTYNKLFMAQTNTVKSSKHPTEDIDEDIHEDLTNLLGDNSRIIREELMYELLDDFQPKIPSNGFSIYDIAFPNPTDENSGLYRSSETQSKIALANPEWKKKIGIELINYGNSKIFTGKFLHIDSIGHYSTKYKQMIEDILKINKLSQKIMIYHDRVRMSGVLLIQEILKANGFIDEFSEPINTTNCSICGNSMDSQHISHGYLPSRFVMAHSDIDKNSMERSIAKFNLADNANGQYYKIIVGSKIIKESYELKNVQNLFIMTLPVNISTLIQVFGRCIRKSSHINLPPEQRIVKIRIYIHRLNTEVPINDSVSPEEYRYFEKLNDYIIIQDIERELNSSAIDAEIHRNIVMPDILKKEYLENPNQVGNLYFEPKFLLKHYKPNELTLDTFIAYEYSNEEIKEIIYIIKRLFTIQRVWKYDDLFKSVKRPPFGVEKNPNMISENSFVIALNNLLYDDLNIATTIPSEQKGIIYTYLNANDRFIYIGSDTKYKIAQVAEYYILFPVKDNKIIKDIDIFTRPLEHKKDVEINIDNYIRNYKSIYNYEIRKKQFIDKYQKEQQLGGDKLIQIFLEYHYTFYFKLLEDIISTDIYSQIEPKNNKYKLDSKTQDLFDDIIDLFDKFYIIIFIEDLITYRDTAKKINNKLIINFKDNNLVSKLDDGTPVGYVAGKSIKLFNNLNEWIEVSKLSMNRFKVFEENDTIVGFFEISEDDRVKFKIRKPIQKLQMDFKKKTKQDARLIERGIACYTRSKQELVHLANKLNIKNIHPVRIKKLCDIIMNTLLELEMKERQKDSRLKFVYLSHEEKPTLIIQ